MSDPTKARLSVAVLVAACATSSRPRVDRPDQLPAHTYRVPKDVGRLVVDDAAFAELARPLRIDVEGDLARYDIRDATTLKDHLFILALLDALDDRWTESLGCIDRVAAVEDKPGDKVMTGLSIRVWADARTHGGDSPVAFRGALERKLSTMPIDLVRQGLSMMRTMGQVFTPEICRQLTDQEVGPKIKDGAVSLAEAQTIAFQRYAVKRLVPVGKVIDDVLGARGIQAIKQ